MRNIYLSHSKNLPSNIIRQVKELNTIFVNYVIPDMLTLIKQEHEYLNNLDKPITPLPLPLNVNIKGSKSLASSITNMY